MYQTPLKCQIFHQPYSPWLTSHPSYLLAEWTSLVSLSQTRGCLWYNMDKSLRVSVLKESDWLYVCYVASLTTEGFFTIMQGGSRILNCSGLRHISYTGDLSPWQPTCQGVLRLIPKQLNLRELFNGNIIHICPFVIARNFEIMTWLVLRN